APEQATSSQEVGPAADVYALGAILYECLTGRPPFLAATAFDTLTQVVSQEPVPPRQLNAGVPADLETVCLHCLRKEPLQRYASANDLADDRRRFLDWMPVRARPVGLLERGLKWARRRPVHATLGGVLTLAGPALLVLSLLYNAAAYQAKTVQEKERERVDGVRTEGRKLIEAGQQALSQGKDLQEARRHLSQALAMIGSHPDLTDLRAHAEDLD